MGHLSGATSLRKITSIEVVSDDSLRVLRFKTNDNGSIDLAERAATESEYSFTSFATLTAEDADLVAKVLTGGDLRYSPSAIKRAEALSGAHRLPEPETVKSAMDGDCTPLDVERAKAANLQEAKQLVQLEMERDHSLDRHIGADVPGCPACDRKVIPSAMPDLNDPEPSYGADLPY